MRVVGTRRVDGPAFDDQGRLVRTAALLRGTAALVPRGVYRSYTDAIADVEQLDLGGVSVPVASPAALIRMKNTYRPQDQLDREYLESLIRKRG